MEGNTSHESHGLVTYAGSAKLLVSWNMDLHVPCVEKDCQPVPSRMALDGGLGPTKAVCQKVVLNLEET